MCVWGGVTERKQTTRALPSPGVGRGGEEAGGPRPQSRVLLTSCMTQCLGNHVFTPNWGPSLPVHWGLLRRLLPRLGTTCVGCTVYGEWDPWLGTPLVHGCG